ncbi:hypothetical protein GCM10023094_32130 [Rhodococcus olei]|uniref:Uncharacterized protein n=1 Tax=Rhodococcus olei TaxID=2161675 RepID=A0ABP8P8Z6_9NOCA
MTEDEAMTPRDDRMADVFRRAAEAMPTDPVAQLQAAWEIADQLDHQLEAIDSGELDATAREIAYRVGAVFALRMIAGPKA